MFFTPFFLPCLPHFLRSMDFGQCGPTGSLWDVPVWWGRRTRVDAEGAGALLPNSHWPGATQGNPCHACHPIPITCWNHRAYLDTLVRSSTGCSGDAELRSPVKNQVPRCCRITALPAPQDAALHLTMPTLSQ